MLTSPDRVTQKSGAIASCQKSVTPRALPFVGLASLAVATWASSAAAETTEPVDAETFAAAKDAVTAADSAIQEAKRQDQASQAAVDRAIEKAPEEEQEDIKAAVDKKLENQAQVQEKEMEKKEKEQDLEKKKKQANECDFDDVGICLMGGLFVASASVTSMQSGAFSGQTSHSVISFSIPYGGIRLRTPSPFSLDAGVMTGIISKSVTVGAANTACRNNATEFESKLPCEGNALLYPYGALFLGPSIGSAGFAALSSYVTLGWARTAVDPEPHLYFGFMLGTLGIERALRLAGGGAE